MKRLFPVLALVLSAGPAFAADDPLSYAVGVAEAKRLNRPLVVFVGSPVKFVENAVSCRGGIADGFPGNGVYLCQPAIRRMRRVEAARVQEAVDYLLRPAPIAIAPAIRPLSNLRPMFFGGS